MTPAETQQDPSGDHRRSTSFRPTDGPTVVQRCPAPLLDIAIEMKISETAYAPETPIFLRLHNTIGSTCVEIQCTPVHGPYYH